MTVEEQTKKYYAQYDTRNGELYKAEVRCLSDFIDNIEITQEVYDNLEQYMYSDGEIVLNPNYDALQLQKAKEEKLAEALDKANDFEQNGTVEYKNCEFEMSVSNQNNLRNTEEALIALERESTNWLDKNDELVELTIEDIKYIRLNLILARIQKLWLNDYPNFKAQIESATTKAEVEAIVIDYNSAE